MRPNEGQVLSRLDIEAQFVFGYLGCLIKIYKQKHIDTASSCGVVQASCYSKNANNRGYLLNICCLFCHMRWSLWMMRGSISKVWEESNVV